MLLFNFITATFTTGIWDFNTSNVTIQRKRRGNSNYNYEISIHLMLLFNLQTQRALQQRHIISIHLMLLFNKQGRYTGCA